MALHLHALRLPFHFKQSGPPPPPPPPDALMFLIIPYIYYFVLLFMFDLSCVKNRMLLFFFSLSSCSRIKTSDKCGGIFERVQQIHTKYQFTLIYITMTESVQHVLIYTALRSRTDLMKQTQNRNKQIFNLE